MRRQPCVDVRTRRATGFEALLRWRHPLRGLVAPEAFIGTAEELGLVGAIGRFALGRACAEAMRWPDGVGVAVNLSPSRFAGGRVVDAVAGASRSSGPPPGRLELEITESVLLHDDEEVLATLRALEDLGVAIAVDDFGTGYSSLGYLRKFSFSKVKIDRSFVQRLGEDRGDTAIVQSILDLCGKLGIRTTAEGVETEQQLGWLAAAGCTEAQGFLFSPAEPADHVPAPLQRLGRAAVDAAAPAGPGGL